MALALVRRSSAIRPSLSTLRGGNSVSGRRRNSASGFFAMGARMTVPAAARQIEASTEALDSYCIGLLHPFDIRGTKVGGLETYLRDFVTFCPENTRALFVGVDSIGDLQLGRIHEISFRGRSFDFMPILHYPDLKAREAARRIRDSITAQFFAAAIRHFPVIAKAFRDRRVSVDLRRVEFAWVPVVLGVPFIQMLHGEGVPPLRMDSLLKNYNFVHNLGERFAMATSRKFLCVNPLITERLQRTYPRHRAKIDTLWTWVNTNIFQPRPMPAIEPFRVAFAGRLDEFKVPPLMFKTIARLREKLAGQLEFHYIGTSDPSRFREFAAIRDITVCHGFCDAAGMATALAEVHAGILTSEFEGMPRCVLETLAVGRPVVAVHLPQLEAVISNGESGFLVPRHQSEEDIAEALALRFLDARCAIVDGRMTPSRISEKIAPFTPQKQLARVYRFHHDIQRDAFVARGGAARSAVG
jgi:glycosyltransferase involved in cell wall biosynthesis